MQYNGFLLVFKILRSDQNILSRPNRNNILVTAWDFYVLDPGLDSNQTPKSLVLVLEFFESFFAVAIEKRPLLVFFLKKSFFVNKSRRMVLGLKRVAQFMQLLATWALPFGGPFPGALTADVVLMMLPDRILRAVKLRAQWVGSENIVWFSHASKQVARKITKINAPNTIHAKVVYNSSIVSSKNADLWHSE